MTGYLEQPFFLKNKDYVKFKYLRTRLSKSGENFKNANQSVFLIVLYKRKLRVYTIYTYKFCDFFRELGCLKVTHNAM